MILFELIEINLSAERARVDLVKYSKRQRLALLRLYDLFEKGEWQACLDHIKAAFPYHKDGYPETEHIGVEVSSVLMRLGFTTYYTQDQLKKETLESKA